MRNRDTVEITGKGGRRVIDRKHLSQYLSKGYRELVPSAVAEAEAPEPVTKYKRKRSKE